MKYIAEVLTKLLILNIGLWGIFFILLLRMWPFIAACTLIYLILHYL